VLRPELHRYAVGLRRRRLLQRDVQKLLHYHRQRRVVSRHAGADAAAHADAGATWLDTRANAGALAGANTALYARAYAGTFAGANAAADAHAYACADARADPDTADARADACATNAITDTFAAGQHHGADTGHAAANTSANADSRARQHVRAYDCADASDRADADATDTIDGVASCCCTDNDQLSAKQCRIVCQLGRSLAHYDGGRCNCDFVNILVVPFRIWGFADDTMRALSIVKISRALSLSRARQLDCLKDGLCFVAC
jgi:hypothetical protein